MTGQNFREGNPFFSFNSGGTALGEFVRGVCAVGGRIRRAAWARALGGDTWGRIWQRERV
jgi:hypothetical protein